MSDATPWPETRSFLKHCLLLSTISACAMYPLLTQPFLFNDDSLLWNTGHCTSHPQFYYLIAIGRWIYPLLACPIWEFVDTISDLTVVRWLTMLLFTLTGALWAHQLTFRGVSPHKALALAGLWGVLPCFQMQIVMANSFPHPFSTFVAALAFFAAERVTDCSRPWRDRQAWIALGLLYAAHCIYTPNAMVYWVFLATSWLIPRTTHSLEPPSIQQAQRIWRVSLPLAAALGYFVTLKTLHPLVLATAHISPTMLRGHSPELSSDLLERLVQIARVLIPKSWALWGGATGTTLFLAWILVCCGAGVLLLRREWRQGLAGGFVWQRLLPLSGCLLGILLPQLAASHLALSFRTTTALSGFGLLLGWRSCQVVLAHLAPMAWRQRLETAGLCIALLAAVVTAQAALQEGIVDPSRAEGRAVQALLLREVLPLQQPGIVYVRRYVSAAPRRSELTCSDEYGFLTTVFAQNLEGYLRAQLQDLGEDPAQVEQWQIVARHTVRQEGAVSSAFRTEPGSVELDLRPFYESQKLLPYEGCGSLGADRRALAP